MTTMFSNLYYREFVFFANSPWATKGTNTTKRFATICKMEDKLELSQGSFRSDQASPNTKTSPLSILADGSTDETTVHPSFGDIFDSFMHAPKHLQRFVGTKLRFSETCACKPLVNHLTKLSFRRASACTSGPVDFRVFMLQ
jgi:hypothetical protein